MNRIEKLEGKALSDGSPDVCRCNRGISKIEIIDDLERAETEKAEFCDVCSGRIEHIIIGP